MERLWWRKAGKRKGKIHEKIEEKTLDKYRHAVYNNTRR